MQGVIIKVSRSGLEIFRKMNARLGVTPKWYCPKDKAETRAVVAELRRCGCTIREGKIKDAINTAMAAFAADPACDHYTYANGPAFKVVGATSVATSFKI